MSAAQRLWLLLDSLDDTGNTVPCRGEHAPLWTSEDRAERGKAARTCRLACPALAVCAEYAAEVKPSFSVWAGVDHGDRPADRRSTT